MSGESAERIDENAEQATRNLLIGRRIVTAEKGSFPVPGNRWSKASGLLILDDDTKVYVVPNDGGCSCGAGDYELEHLSTVDTILSILQEASPLHALPYFPRFGCKGRVA